MVVVILMTVVVLLLMLAFHYRSKAAELSTWLEDTVVQAELRHYPKGDFQQIQLARCEEGLCFHDFGAEHAGDKYGYKRR